ncbi:MAG: prolipoprotein diacylglyceryl transferase [Oscillospiraceae bacterium]|nr:prolipoprotein diacylglyceryl transferase [Oscillospiraceae bacterium]
MNEIISFPGLGLEFSIDRVAFSIFGKPIYWYGVIIAVGFLLAVLYTMRRVKEFGLDSDRVIDVLLGAVITGMIGARIYYVIFSWDMYRENPIDALKIWNGGIAIYGGVIGALLGGWLFCRLRKVKFLPMCDLCVAGLMLAQGIGRWGNFVNGEAFGSATTLPWRMTSAYENGAWLTKMQEYLAGLPEETLAALGDQAGVHPTFFYESIWCILGFFFLAWLTKRRRFDGELLLVYAAWYGAERAVVEGLRTDSLMLGNLRISQFVAIVTALAALVALFIIRSRIRSSNDPEFMKLYVHSEEAEQIRQGSFYQKKAEKAEAESDEKTEEKDGEDPEKGSDAEEAEKEETAEPAAEKASEPAGQDGSGDGEPTAEETGDADSVKDGND